MLLRLELKNILNKRSIIYLQHRGLIILFYVIQLLFFVGELFNKKMWVVNYIAKAGRLDHIWPVRLQLTYITIQQAFNSGFCWSILSG